MSAAAASCPAPGVDLAANSAEALSHPKYRRDIDGLRAVAVLAVVVYHAFPEWMPGGFIGVDIFFVISGFLISTILFGNLGRGDIALTAFYSRRIRRIFPALIVVLVASLVMGWTVLWQDEFKQLGGHVAGGAAFLSNFVLWRESGYFDTAAASKPLLHLWSLAIEEQFYIFYPVVLWCAWKCRINLLLVTALIALISFGLGMTAIQSDEVAAFYFPHLRFWELMTGAMLAYGTLWMSNRSLSSGTRFPWLRDALARIDSDASGRLASCLSLAGMILIAAGLLAVTKESAFPGAWALLPNLGAVLVIAGGSAAWTNRTLLSSAPLVWIGLISYPLYLWHWVLLSFARILAGDVPTTRSRVLLVMLAVCLSWLTYKFVETPLRFGARTKFKSVALAVSMLAVCAAGGAAYWLDGVAGRFVATQSLTLRSGEDGGFGGMSETCAAPMHSSPRLHCVRDRREPPTYALLGDSKAIALAPGAFRTSLPGGRWLFVRNDDFHPLLAASATGAMPDASAASDAMLNQVARMESVKYVVVAVAVRRLFKLKGSDTIDDLPESGNYAMAVRNLQKITERWIAAGKKVVLVVDNPALPAPQDCLTRKTYFDSLNEAFVRTKPSCRLELNYYLQQRGQYMKALEEVRQRFPGHVEIFDATHLLCDRDAGVCPAARQGRVLYGFTDHISDYASGLVGRELNTFLARQ